jgi:hypothetical protein
VASRAVSVRFCSGIVRSFRATFLASVTMRAEASKQVRRGDLQGLIVTLERDDQVAVYGEHSTGSQHLQH